MKSLALVVTVVLGLNLAAAALSSPEADAPGDEPRGTDRCLSRPAPPEHKDGACDRSAQNARRIADHARNRSLPRESLVPDHVYLNMPEERTWTCPPEDAGAAGVDDDAVATAEHGRLGHPTRWVVYNRASGPVIVSRVNAAGVEVPATATATTGNSKSSSSSSSSSSAVWPRGPILLPGSMAVVEGRAGRVFVIREYEEVLVPHFVEGVLPRTLSFLPPPGEGGEGQTTATRFVSSDGASHVSGRPGRVLMRHRMGNIYVRNLHGVACPMVLYDHDKDKNAGRRGTPKDFNPNCNVLQKAFINKVGCPIDIYFSPKDMDRGDMPEGLEGPMLEEKYCEIFQKHLGPLEPYLASDPSTRNIDDGWRSPLTFVNTYNRHSFVARMSHDQSLVARISLDHDVVFDCPEPGRVGFGVAAEERGGTIEGEGAADAVGSWPANSTTSVRALDIDAVVCRLIDAKVDNSTAAHLVGVVSASA
ncbi:hypothetical protein ACHAW5_000825 [Stephanodiscus triporus]|uniref:Amine oxidase n=1 Tax=Stephanodiscus triporus TaxID=2934178 RepID=A0ABD3NFS9_9STRA